MLIHICDEQNWRFHHGWSADPLEWIWRALYWSSDEASLQYNYIEGSWLSCQLRQHYFVWAFFLEVLTNEFIAIVVHALVWLRISTKLIVFKRLCWNEWWRMYDWYDFGNINNIIDACHCQENIIDVYNPNFPGSYHVDSYYVPWINIQYVLRWYLGIMTIDAFVLLSILADSYYLCYLIGHVWKPIIRR